MNKRPQNKEELFNLRHLKLRNSIKRIFGIIKARFKILTIPRSFKLPAQARVVVALAVLHNILIEFHDGDDKEEVDQRSQSQLKTIILL